MASAGQPVEWVSTSAKSRICNELCDGDPSFTPLLSLVGIENLKKKKKNKRSEEKLLGGGCRTGACHMSCYPPANIHRLIATLHARSHAFSFSFLLCTNFHSNIYLSFFFFLSWRKNMIFTWLITPPLNPRVRSRRPFPPCRCHTSKGSSSSTQWEWWWCHRKVMRCLSRAFVLQGYAMPASYCLVLQGYAMPVTYYSCIPYLAPIAIVVSHCTPFAIRL